MHSFVHSFIYSFIKYLLDASYLSLFLEIQRYIKSIRNDSERNKLPRDNYSSIEFGDKKEAQYILEKKHTVRMVPKQE